MGLPLPSTSNAAEHDIVVLYFVTEVALEPACVHRYISHSPSFVCDCIFHSRLLRLRSNRIVPTTPHSFDSPSTPVSLCRWTRPIISTSSVRRTCISQRSCNHVEGHYLGKLLGTDLRTHRTSSLLLGSAVFILAIPLSMTPFHFFSAPRLFSPAATL